MGQLVTNETNELLSRIKSVALGTTLPLQARYSWKGRPSAFSSEVKPVADIQVLDVPGGELFRTVLTQV